MRKGSLMFPKLLSILFAFSMACAPDAFCRDFPQPFEVADPLYGSAPSESGWMPRGYTELIYCTHLLRSSPEDSFDVRALSSFTLLDVDSRFALNLYWGGILLVGPLAEGETAATMMQWWMNANQFEYGLAAGAGLGVLDLSFEYSRTSQHPWRGDYSQVTTDALKWGLTLPELRAGLFEFDLRCFAGYVDLFDFWKSSVPKPRTIWIASPAARISLHAMPGISLFVRCQADLLLLRGGGTDADLWAEFGIRTGRGTGRAEFYLDYFGSGDTEELDKGPAPSSLLGLGFRLYR